MSETATSPVPQVPVFVVDDDQRVRRAMCELVEGDPDLTVVGMAGSVADALERIPAAAPDVAVLPVRLDDIAYGRRRVTIRHRDDHPSGVRSKSRTERVVDLHEGPALAAVSAYVMDERPADAATPLVFLVAVGPRRGQPLSYDGLVRMFARCAQRAGIRQPWITPHTLRHTHATRMWESGMRELALQRRLGHASAESTRRYTRVFDPQVVSEYLAALGRHGDDA
jgi:integrase